MYQDPVSIKTIEEQCPEPLRTALLSAPDFDYQPKTDEEIREIALGLFHGQIWMRICTEEEARMMFMPLAFLDQAQLYSLVKLGASVYEHVNKVGPRSINGLPSFFSMKILSRTDSEKVFRKYEELAKAVETV